MLPGLTLPYFVDIDNDGDFDCFIADAHSGALRYYENTGSRTQPEFEMQSAAMNPLSMVKFYTSNVAEAAFQDLYNNGTYDCLITDLDGQEYFFKNTGTPAKPKFAFQSSNNDPFNNLASSDIKNVSFYDWNKDGLIDLFSGQEYYKNRGTSSNPKFALNKSENPKFESDTRNFQLQWVNFNPDKPVTIVIGNQTGSFDFLTVASSATSSLKLANISISTYPNPSKSEFTIQYKRNGLSQMSIRIADVDGHVLDVFKTFENSLTFGKDLHPGIYIVQLYNDNNLIYNQKIVKQ